MSDPSFSNILDTIPLGIIKESSIHGYGLFAKEAIPAGITLCILTGQLVPYSFYLRQETQWLEWNAIENEQLIVRCFRTKYSFINHSRTPNCSVVRHPHSVITLTAINSGEELTLDYRNEPLPQSYLNGHGSTYL